MITISTNDKNDIFINASGNLELVSGPQSAVQTVRHAVLTNLGELSLNRQAGVAYFETVFCDTPDLEAFQQSVQSAAEKVEEVQSVDEFLMQNQEGVLRYQMNITLKDGSEVAVNG